MAIGIYIMAGTTVFGLLVLLAHEIWYRRTKQRDAQELAGRVRQEQPPAFTSMKRY